MLIFLSNLGMGASGAEIVVVEAVLDKGRDSGGGHPAWWEGRWITPPRSPIPVEARVPVKKGPKVEITVRQQAKLDESFQARASIAELTVDIARFEEATAAIGTAIDKAGSKRARKRLYDEREKLKRGTRAAKDEVGALESQVEQARAELEGLEWLAFLQTEDDKFIRMVLELI